MGRMGRRGAWLGLLGLSLAVVWPATVTAQEATPVAAGATPVASVAADAAVVATSVLPALALAEVQNAALPAAPIADDRGILLGGVGSDLWQGPDDADDEFWMVTDRGPNRDVEVGDEERLTFPVPDFTPYILHVRAEGEVLTVLDALPIVGASGAPVTGLSNLDGHDATPYDVTGEEALPFNPNGIDSEGLVRTADGGFWLAEEYGPSLLRLEADGTVAARYVPEGLGLAGTDVEVVESLPAVYAERRGNRGFEGLALSPDGETLYALLQSPLNNPDGDAGEASRNGRILAVDAASGEPTAEYVYPFELGPEFDPAEGIEQGDMKLSGVVALDADTLLVLERTDEVARLYAAELAGATDILGTAWDDPATSPSLEATADLAAAGVAPLAKTLVVDLDALPGMPDKIEGVAVVDADTLAVANDNDFDIAFDASGRNVGEGRTSQLLVIDSPVLARVLGQQGGPQQRCTIIRPC